MEAGALHFPDDTMAADSPIAIVDTMAPYHQQLPPVVPQLVFPPVPQQVVFEADDPAEAIFSFSMSILFAIFVLYSVVRWCYGSRQRFTNAFRGFRAPAVLPNDDQQIVIEQRPQQQESCIVAPQQ